MNFFLEKILKDNQFNQVSIEEKIFTNELKSEYYLIENYSEEELYGFFDSQLTGSLISKFMEMQKKEAYKNIKKNTSLFILVKVSNIKESYKKMMNQLILIEEDSYYFRKFVILYTDIALLGLKEFENTKKLYDLVEKDIKKFEEDMFFDDSYYLAMQVLIKLPFYKIENSNITYLTIEEQYIDQVSDKKDLKILDLFSDTTVDYSTSLCEIDNESILITELSNLIKEENVD